MHAPPLPWVPIALDALRAKLFAALRPGHGIEVDASFPSLNHSRVHSLSWAWDQRANWESGLTLSPGCVTIGYQYEHDMAWSEYAPKRVLSGDPRAAYSRRVHGVEESDSHS